MNSCDFFMVEIFLQGAFNTFEIFFYTFYIFDSRPIPLYVLNEFECLMEKNDKSSQNDVKREFI